MPSVPYAFSAVGDAPIFTAHVKIPPLAVRKLVGVAGRGSSPFDSRRLQTSLGWRLPAAQCLFRNGIGGGQLKVTTNREFGDLRSHS